MTTYDRAQALARALASKAYAVGMCLQWTRIQYGIPGGTPDATTAWLNAKRRHPGDRTPPAGVPVFWTGGSKGHGHVAISLGDGRIRGTDSPTPGHIGTVPIEWVERNWGLRYAGWTEDLNGVLIPTPAPRPATPPASSSKGLTRVRIQHASMQWSDPAAHKRADAAQVFIPGAHVITFTEVGKGQNPNGRAYLADQAKRHGYTLIAPGYEGALAIRFRNGKVIASGYEGPLIPGKAGDHPHLGLTWATVRHTTLGDMTFGVAHWLARDNEPPRARTNNAMTKAIGRFLAAKAQGTRLAFISGDVNRDDATRDVLPGTDFTTVWDELRKYPDTHGRRTIDVIASYDPDKRVRALSGGVLPAAHSDHRWIQAVYGIRPL